MSTNVINLPVVTRLDIPSERVLAEAVKEDLEFVVVIGETKDGGFYFASSKASGPDILWQLEQAKLALLHAGGAFPEEG